MKVENIYKVLKEVIYPIHSHNDQIIAIAHWVAESPARESRLKQIKDFLGEDLYDNQ